MITFSVITCTYNASAEVERTLDSVRFQSYAHVEHFIQDGCSKDGTMDMVRRYAEGDNGEHTVVVVSEPDKGLYDAMNRAIARATGDYIIFMNAGDKFASDDVLANIAGRMPDGELPGVIYGDTDIVDGEGKFLHKRRLSPPDRLDWKSFRHGMLVCHQSFYARTDLAKAEPYDLGFRFSADVDWCIRIMKRAARQGLSLFNTRMTLTSYLDGGMSIKNHRASLIERFRIMCRHYGVVSTVVMHLWFVVRGISNKF